MSSITSTTPHPLLQEPSSLPPPEHPLVSIEAVQLESRFDHDFASLSEIYTVTALPQQENQLSLNSLTFTKYFISFSGADGGGTKDTPTSAPDLILFVAESAYPNVAPMLKLYTSTFASLLPHTSGGYVDVEIAMQAPWTQDLTFYHLIVAIHSIIEVNLVPPSLLTHRDHVKTVLDCWKLTFVSAELGIKVRDFAYPPHDCRHWGRSMLSSSDRVRALYAFDSQDENELSFVCGDIIDVVYKRKDQWIVGVLNGLSGLVPANHVEPFHE